MADNVPITAGSGTNIATDDVGGIHYQKVKLDLGGDGASTPVTVTVPVSGAAADGAAVAGNPVLVAGQDGTNAQSFKTDSTGRLEVIDGGQSLTVDGTVSATSAGDVAHDTGDSGNPVKIGAKAETDLAAATMVADGDRTDLYADIDGVQLSKPFCPFNNILSERVTNTNGTSTAFSTFGATASARNYITTIVVHNDSTTDGFVDIRDGTAGSVLLTVPAPQKGGAVINLPVPLRQPTANTALAYDVSAAITTVYITVVGFKSKA